MNLRTKLYLSAAVLTILFAAACAKKPEAYHCLAQANEQCATDEWYQELQQLQALNKKYGPPADVQQQMKEKLALLQSTVPPGYDWNDQKKVFVRKSPPMPSMSTPIPAVPAK